MSGERQYPGIIHYGDCGHPVSLSDPRILRQIASEAHHVLCRDCLKEIERQGAEDMGDGLRHD